MRVAKEEAPLRRGQVSSAKRGKVRLLLVVLPREKIAVAIRVPVSEESPGQNEPRRRHRRSRVAFRSRGVDDRARCAAPGGAGGRDAHNPCHDLVVIEALTLARGNHPKRVLLEGAWNRAGEQSRPGALTLLNASS